MPSREAVETVRDWFGRLDGPTVPGGKAWSCALGGEVVRFACANREIASACASRFHRGASGSDNGMRWTFVEIDEAGWPALPGGSDPLAVLHELSREAIAAVLLPGGPLGEGELSVLFDTASNRGLVAVRSVGRMPLWARGAPFTIALHLAFAWAGARLLHGATLGRRGRGVLLAGAGGAGKSAATISGLLKGLTTVGDDYVVLREDGEGFSAWPVYRHLKQDPAGLSRFPVLQRQTEGRPLNWHGKVEFDADLVRPGALAESMEIDAILIPRRRGARSATSFADAAPPAAFAALASSTLLQLPGAAKTGFGIMTRLSRRVPAYYMDAGSDPAEVGEAVCGMLDRLRP